LEATRDPLALRDRRALEGVVPPVRLDRLRRGLEGGGDAAERAVVLSRLPHVEVGADEREGERQTGRADRLREAHDVGDDAGLLEAEERARAAAAHLDIVDDEEDLVLAAEVREPSEPFSARSVDAALALHRLDDDRGGQVEPAAAVLEEPAE